MEDEDILKVTQPESRKRLLDEFADSCESDASELKVAALPRQATKVILPLTKINENEVYAPGYRNGEQVALVRYPHAGVFEIPVLTVNNGNKQGKSLLKQAVDAIGINPKVADQLSGADFDGDTVVVLPTNGYKIKADKPWTELTSFNTKDAYPEVPGMKKMTNTQLEMGKVSNLITDMTVRGATRDELVKAVKHSMVVIDAEKHNLNWKQSEKDNEIAKLKQKYQGGTNAGASTLLSKANKEVEVSNRIKKIDPETGKISYDYENAVKKTKVVPAKKDENKNVLEWKEVEKKTKSTLMREHEDAFELSSGSRKETIYANYANSLKSLANSARKESLSTVSTKKNSNAEKIYAKEVQSLNSKYNEVLRNKPRERKAQIMADTVVRQKIKSNPDITYEEKKELRKKVATQAIASERKNSKTERKSIEVTSKEWEAINAGAMSADKTKKIIDKVDKQTLRDYAMPKNPTTVSSSKIARINALNNNGYTLAEIADSVGLSVSTVNKYIA